ncbi:hypothetical protein QR680_008625 [Steinernema hermaphroditum]|uniref:G-protein coupled receptors family 1 profile domain-containing protein n=1 Tax=Steinernema hermaphroditum TaxID=289476 RepID=A0AA39IJ86_9BILA|nr:hypothetical protein QR680_008625 [Steinernema hermaphroditum]
MPMGAIDEHVAVSCFRIFIWIAAVSGNTLILFIVFAQRNLRKKGANLLFAQLSIADFITGTESGVRGLSIVLFNAFNYHDYTKRLCLYLGIPGLLGIHMSQLTMLAIAVDRLLCIKFPILYRNLETMTFAFIRFSVCFGFSAAMTGVAFVGIGQRGDDRIAVCSTGRSLAPWYAQHYWVFLACFFTLFIYAIYIAIYVLFTRQQSSSFGNSAVQKAIFITMTAVLVSYFFFWCIPNVLYVVFKNIGLSETVLGYNSSLIGLLSGVNSATNVLIYGWKHPELRGHMRRVLKGEKASIVTATASRPSMSHLAPATHVTHA